MRRAARAWAVAGAIGCGGGGGVAGEATEVATTAAASEGATAASEATVDAPPSEPTSGTTGSPPPHACEASGVCFGAGGCVECSLADACADELATCNAAPGDACNLYTACALGCQGEGVCLQGCGLLHPDGYTPAWALVDCELCAVCPSSCDAFAGYCATGGGGPGKAETCDELGECAACAGCSAVEGCYAEAVACADDPQCKPYRDCAAQCDAADRWCHALCEFWYPEGYATSWAAYDCALCSECPQSCSAQAGYCAAGGGGPAGTECLANLDCVEYYDARPYCVDNACVECLADADCLDPAFASCQGNFCR
ncbi:MAG: hypothetical protein JNL82_05645 [Myxococcales bacterium]|nr:hypothetical protein [Myxococcales bacterium]